MNFPEQFGLKPEPKGSLYATKLWREFERPRLEKWLLANGWRSEGREEWSLDGQTVRFKVAIARQLIACWHERIRQRALAQTRLPPPPARNDPASLADWLRACGCGPHQFDLDADGNNPMGKWWAVPGSGVDWSLRQAAEIMFDRYLAQQGELRGWDWCGWMGRPKSFVTPEGRHVGRRRAAAELIGDSSTRALVTY